MFRLRKPLILSNLHNVPKEPGVYIIYAADRTPFYVGRSLVSIYDRLYCHATRRGSKKVREALNQGEILSFEWQELSSPHQAEAQLIAALGTVTAGNLRRETDPADW
jgi:excinuclease UvrABC nuclease subunit